MEKPKYKAIVFDFFGVISSEVAPIWLEKYFSGEDITELREKYIKPTDRGDISENQFFDVLSSMVSTPSKEIRREWLELVVINASILELIKKLRSKYKLAILSDTPSPFFWEIISQNKLEGLFDKVIVSSEIRMTKADVEIYKLILEDLGILPKEAIFIDDNPANVERARSLGIKGFVFTSEIKLKTDLSSLGITE